MKMYSFLLVFQYLTQFSQIWRISFSSPTFRNFHSSVILSSIWPLECSPSKEIIVEALQFHSNTQSHWSSESTVYFPSKVSAVRVLEMHKFTMKPGFSSWRCLDTLVTPTWLIIGLALGFVLTMGSFTKFRTVNVKSQLWSHIAFPCSFSSLQHSDR